MYKYNINLIVLLNLDVVKENLQTMIPRECISNPWSEAKIISQKTFSRKSGCKGRSVNLVSSFFPSLRTGSSVFALHLWKQEKEIP